jgi:predicted component of type VI protein secretion system
LLERFSDTAERRLAVPESIEKYLLHILNTVEGSAPAAPRYGRPEFSDVRLAGELARVLEKRIPTLDRRVKGVRIRMLESQKRKPGELAFLVEWWLPDTEARNQFIAKRSDDGHFQIPNVMSRASL